ncbi:MAG: hypothetical protein WA970_00490 [Gammaproteobacteria bacterium]
MIGYRFEQGMRGYRDDAMDADAEQVVKTEVPIKRSARNQANVSPLSFALYPQASFVLAGLTSMLTGTRLADRGVLYHKNN